MNHKKHYDKLIEKAIERNWDRTTAPCYVERHHIIPKCLNGTDDPNNLVFLTAKEHYIAHLLLPKIYKTNPYTIKSLRAAFLAMANLAYQKEGLKEKRTSRLYESFRKKVSEDSKGELNPMWGKTTSEKQKEAVRSYRKGLKESDETRQKKRLSATGKRHTEASKEKNRQWHLGRKQSPETIEKKRQIRIGKGQTEFQKKRAAEANSMKWVIIHPDGREEQIVNLHAFCREHKLSSGNFISHGHTKGYRARKA